MEPCNLQDLQDLIISTDFPASEDKAWSIPVQILIDQYETTQYNDALCSGNFSLVLPLGPGIPHTEEKLELVAPKTKKARERKRIQKSRGTSTLHICDTCSKEFDTKTLFIRHLKSHSGQRKYKCHVCDQSYKYSWLRDKHLKYKHLCKSINISAGGSKETEVSEYNPNCTADHASSSTANCDSNPIKPGGPSNPSELGGAVHFCKLCEKSFPYWNTYLLHLKSHQGLKDLICAKEQCNKTFRTISQLNEHIKSHDRSFLCNICNRPFKSRSGLRSHKTKHNDVGTEKHQCNTCGKEYDTSKALKMHQRCHTRQQSDRLEDSTVKRSSGTIELAMETKGSSSSGSSEKFSSVLYEKIGDKVWYRCGICPNIRFQDITTTISHMCVSHSLEKVADVVLAKQYKKIVER